MTDFTVQMPGGGGTLPVQTAEEVDRWNTLSSRYQDEYKLTKVNDLTNLTTLLVQHMNLYRAQLGLSGRVPQVDEDTGLATGRYETRVLKPAEIKNYQEQITAASKEVREIEKTMGIDKKSREAAGDETLRGWLVAMKARAHRYGLHVSGRVKLQEEFFNEIVWRLRLNEIGDGEDKHYEDCTDEGLIKWARRQTAEITERDKVFAREEGQRALVVGSAIMPSAATNGSAP